MPLFKVGDIVKYKPNADSDKARNNESIRSLKFKIKSFCNCGEGYLCAENREVQMEGRGYIAYESDLMFVSSDTMSELDWLDAVKYNFKDGG